MLEFLTDELRAALRNTNMRFVYELRIRAGKPVAVNYKGAYSFLGKSGITDKQSAALTASAADVEEIVFRASNYSVYSVTEQMKQGFITGAYGERIGLAGMYVYEGGEAFTVRDVTSLNIRVPHEVRGSAEQIFSCCFSERAASALILSPPGRGKTTILRDLARLLAERRVNNVLISDERGEIGAAGDASDTGVFSDVIRFARKKDALTAAVRAMRPDVIVTDELVSAEELAAVAMCVRGGVEVLASAHLRGVTALCDSPVFSPFVREKVFSYYIVLRADGVGEVEGIYGADLLPIPMRQPC